MDSEAYAAWLKRWPDGAPPADSGSFRSAPVEVKPRALITSADALAGTLVRPDYRGLLEPGLGVRSPCERS